MRKTKSIAGFLLFAASLPLFAPGCVYVTSNQKDVLIKGIDFDQTLKIARDELDKNKWGAVLTVWAIRDQEIPTPAVREISALYFSHIDTLKHSFNVWHFTWAVSNIYREGNDSVRTILAAAYNNARPRAHALGGLADRHVNGERVYMGDFHFLGRRYKVTHVVVPGDTRFIQSYQAYAQKHR